MTMSAGEWREDSPDWSDAGKDIEVDDGLTIRRANLGSPQMIFDGEDEWPMFDQIKADDGLPIDFWGAARWRIVESGSE